MSSVVADSILCGVEVLHVGQLRDNEHLLGSSQRRAERTKVLVDLVRCPQSLSTVSDHLELAPSQLEEVGRVLNLSEFDRSVLLDEGLEGLVSSPRQLQGDLLDTHTHTHTHKYHSFNTHTHRSFNTLLV